MKVIAKSRNGKMLKIGEDEKSAKWYFLADPVIKFVEGNIEVGSEVTIKYEQSGGKSIITYITKGEGISTETPPKDSKPTCEICGKELKDSKYKKCYSCQYLNKNEENSNTPTEYIDTSISKDELIKREAVAHATSRVMIGLQGHINPNNVSTIYTTVYNIILKLVENK